MINSRGLLGSPSSRDTHSAQEIIAQITDCVLPGLEEATDYVGELVPVHDIPGSVLVHTEFSLGTRHLPEVVALRLEIALAVGQCVEVREHPLARDVSVGDRVVPVVVHKSAAIEDGEGQIHGQRTSGRDVPIDVSIGVPQGRSFCLLESELDEELEELLSRIEAARDVGAMARTCCRQDKG